MKTFAIQKQLIETDQGTDAGWRDRQVWVYKLSEEDKVYEYDDLYSAQQKRNELEENDPTDRVYRVVERKSKFKHKVV